MKLDLDPNRPVGFESRKTYRRRCESGFWERFVPGPLVLDIGFRGGISDALPILPGAIGIELGYPGYDGLHLPWPDGGVDCICSSHVLEHVMPTGDYLREWFRVLRTGGTMILMVPHAYLYERRLTVPPSRWSPEHLFAVTPATLLTAVEEALAPNSYRILHLADADDGYDYSLPPESHPTGALEIELVICKREPPAWQVEP